MKVAGFSFIKNAIEYDYPIVEAINSILPICDQFVIAIGNGIDNTTELIKSIKSPKIKIIYTEWDNSLREGGAVLADETNKAFAAIDKDIDWCFYIQGDEVVHEQYLSTIYNSMQEYVSDMNVDGLLFDYTHFYGSYDYVAVSSGWYKKEVRIIRNRRDIYSYKDAQGFRKGNNNKLNVKSISARIYHYGWVKPPEAMQKKQKSFQRLWHSDLWVSNNVPNSYEFDYSGIDRLQTFNGTHPKVMLPRIKAKNWYFAHDISKNKISFKDKIKDLLFNWFGLNFNYKNYNEI